jgi:hypothetical protein
VDPAELLDLLTRPAEPAKHLAMSHGKLTRYGTLLRVERGELRTGALIGLQNRGATPHF